MFEILVFEKLTKNVLPPSLALNFFLARHLIRGTPDTEEFNAGLGKMHLWNLPVIVLPSMVMLVAILWRLIAGVQRLSGQEQEAIFKNSAGKTSPRAE